MAVEIIESPKKPEPCGPNWYGSKDDLCAQWKAADSAAEAATWANWQLWLSGAGIVGLLFSLYYTRKAVLVAEDATKDADAALKIAETSANAAVAAVKLSETTANHQLRAYLAISEIKAAPDKSGHITARVLVKNFGSTPAHNVTAQITGWVGAFPSHVLDGKHPEPEDQTCPQTVHPSADFELYASADTPNIATIFDGDEGFYVYGHVAYCDFNNVERRTNFCYRGTDSTLMNKGELRVSFEGNDAT